MKLAFEQHGTGETVVLLHGFPFSRQMWSTNIAGLTSEGFRVVVPDLRGFGESVNFADINTMEDMANDVNELLNSLEIGRAAIGGLSMGGYVLFELFKLAPEKFSAVILCDTTFASDSPDKKQSRYDLIEEIETNGSEALVDSMLSNLVSEHTRATNPELIEKIRNWISQADSKAVVAALRGMAERRDSFDLLKKISVPTLIVFGEEDKITGVEVAEGMSEQIGVAELRTIANAGHLSNVEQPSEFTAILAEFLKNGAS